MHDAADDTLSRSVHQFSFQHHTLATLNETLIAQNTLHGIYAESIATTDLTIQQIQIDFGVFIRKQQNILSPIVTVTQGNNQLLLTCDCNGVPGKLCIHEAEILITLRSYNELGIFFKELFRHQQLEKTLKDYGLNPDENPDTHFELLYENKKLSIRPRNASLLPVTDLSLKAISDRLELSETTSIQMPVTDSDETKIVLLRQHKFHKYLIVDLISAAETKEGKIKNPLNLLSPLDFLWQSDDSHMLKFFAAIHKLQQHSDGKRSTEDIRALKAIIKNPEKIPCYKHDSGVSEKITTAAIKRVQLSLFTGKILLHISKTGSFYQLHGSLENKGLQHSIKDVALQFNYFLAFENDLLLLEQIALLNLIDFLKQKDNEIVIHASKFKLFKTTILEKLAGKVVIDYKYIPAATQFQLKEQGFHQANKKIIYLSESGNHVLITPTISYSDIEIPVRSKRQIFGEDNAGNEFIVQRDNDAEIAFTAFVARQHLFFEEQVENDHEHFYLHKERFMDENWFPNVFEAWAQQDILVLGFNELEGNNLNAHKIKVNIKVLSGINWFNAEVKVYFGKQKVPLKSIQKSIRHRSKYIQLDDGTLGILPEEWFEKFRHYFNAGSIDGTSILIDKIHYSDIETWFDEAELDKTSFDAIRKYEQKWTALSDKTIEVPAALNATLRSYQLEGLRWLTFLDDCGFGGCLADDMGLGKSIQIIAFILSQRTKAATNVNLLIVPTTLISNWQSELEKFAPSIKVLTLHGSDRERTSVNFQKYEVILTTYGTLTADIEYLKTFGFNYIFLDESQYIKNPESQRYKAARLLEAKNRIVITGTPIENNTFDLYSQFSFACPGLLGSKQYFKDVYATPIDTFKVKKRARELQQKICPFLLRRTKQQVAQELPAKTEMILYCEMEAEQRKIYDAHEKEFRDFISATTNDELKKSPMNVLNGLTKLRQICNAPSLMQSEAITETGSAKLKVLLQEIENKSPQHKILVFSQFVSMLDFIKKELQQKNVPFEYLTGQTKNRAAVINAFQNNDTIRVFLISLKAGGTGLNLTKADYVYLVDPWWNPAVENQAIDRAHRMGQDKHVVAVRLICPNTIEDKILKMQQSKKTLTDDLIKAENNTEATFRKEALLALLNA